MSSFKKSQYQRQEQLINDSEIFENDPGSGFFKGRYRPFVLKDGLKNLYALIRTDVLKYFADNDISWWGGNRPSGHTLSSQIACLNHLFAIRKDRDAVLSLLNGVRNEFKDVLPVKCDKESAFIGFEVVSKDDHLNEKTCTRGSNCTSVDAFILARHRENDSVWLIPIEWKYTESYENQDKSNEDRDNEPKGSNGKGMERLRRYSGLIDASAQLRSLESYAGSVYYQEPFYQLMRQTLWAENIVKHKDTEVLEADDYLHIHVIPEDNRDLLDKRYKVSGKGMEETWREMLVDQSKYVIISPKALMAPVAPKYPDLTDYLAERYW